MGVFDSDEVQGAEEQGGGSPPYFQPGTYIVKLAQLKELDPNSSDPRKRTRSGRAFVINGTVVAARSSHPKAPEEGTLAGQWIGLDKNKEDAKKLARADVKAFGILLAKALGGNPDAWTKEQWAKFDKVIMSKDGRALADNPKMPLLKLECFMNRAGTFTIHRWHVATPEDLAEFGVAA